MNVMLRTLVLFPLAALLACGSTQNTTATVAPSGKWQIAATNSGTVAGFLGELQFSGGAVTGELGPSAFSSLPAACATGMAQVSGTLDSSNNLTLTVPVGGGTATITATLGSNPQNAVTGFYQIIGGSCPMSSTPMTIGQFASATGTYSGSLNLNISDPSPQTATVVTLVLTQSSTPNASGYYPVTGTVTASGYCNDSYSFTTGIAYGSWITYAAPASTTGTAGPNFQAYLDPNASTLTFAGIVDLSSADTNCGSPSTGTLSRQ